MRTCTHHLGLHMQVVAQRLHACVAGLGSVGFKDGTVGQRGDGEDGCDFTADIGQALGQNAVGLGERYGALLDAQQLQNFKVLYGLGHHAVIGGDDEQGMVNAHGPCGHGVHEFFMARYVDDAQHIAIGQGAVGIAQLDGNAAGFLFLEAVSFHAGEGANQCGFAVVDMACGSDNHECQSYFDSC